MSQRRVVSPGDRFRNLLIPLTAELSPKAAGFVGYTWALRCPDSLAGCTSEEKRLLRVAAYLVCHQKWTSTLSRTRRIQHTDEMSPHEYRRAESSLNEDLGLVDAHKVGALLLSTKLLWFRSGDECGRPLFSGIVRTLAEELIPVDKTMPVSMRRQTDLIRALGQWVCTTGAMFAWEMIHVVSANMSPNIPRYKDKSSKKSPYLPEILVDDITLHLAGPPAGAAKLWNVATAIEEVETTKYVDILSSHRNEVRVIKESIELIRKDPLSFHIVGQSITGRPRLAVRPPSPPLVFKLSQFMFAYMPSSTLAGARVFKLSPKVVNGEIYKKISAEINSEKNPEVKVAIASPVDNSQVDSQTDYSAKNCPLESSTRAAKRDPDEGNTKG